MTYTHILIYYYGRIIIADGDYADNVGCFWYIFRGLQYVHCVMHKCITVKVGGKNTRKVLKTQRFNEIRGTFCIGEKEKFNEIGGK